MFWRRSRKADDGAARASGAPNDEDDLAKLQRQFGIKTVSDKDVEADFLKLLGGAGKTTAGNDHGLGLGLGLSPRSELALFRTSGGAGGDKDDSDEEAQILRQLNLGGDLDAIDADALSGEEEEEEDEDEGAKGAKRELRGVLGDVHREAKRNAAKNEPLEAAAAPSSESESGRLRERIYAMKRQAVALKRGGNVQEALTVFREIKVLEAQLTSGDSTSKALVGGTHQQPIPSTISYGGNEDGDGKEVDVTDDDMVNPEYLAQLAAMGLAAPTPAAPVVVETVESLAHAIRATKEKAVLLKRNNQIAEALAEMRKIKALEAKLAVLTVASTALQSDAGGDLLTATPPVANPLPDAASDSDVEVTDDDMNDPAFAAELQKMGFNPAETSEEDQVEETNETDMASPIVLSVQHPISTTERSVQYSKRYSSVNDDDLIDEFEEDDDDEEDEGEDHEEEKASVPNERDEPKPSPSTEEKEENNISAMATQEPPAEIRAASNGASIEDLLAQLEKTKLSAVQYKRQGNIQAALDMMRRMKQIETLVQMKRRQAPVIPMILSPEDMERRRRFGELEALLVQFANDATREAKDQLSINRAKAAEWLARRKEYSAHLQILREKRQLSGQDPPLYHTEQLTEQVQIEHTDVPVDEVHVQIDAIHDLGPAQGKEVFVKFNLSFPSTAPHEGKSGTCRIASAPPHTGRITSEHAFRFKVQRGRGTQRLFEIKKAVFEVWRPGSLLRNPEMIARGYQELAPLLTTSEIKARVLFVGSNRKPVGGDVEVTFRLRTPLRDKEYKTLTTEVLRIGEYPPPQSVVIQSPVSRPAARSEPTSPTSPSQTPLPSQSEATMAPLEEDNKAGTMSHSMSAPALNTGSLSIPTASDSGGLDDPHALDLIVSYDVINDEIERIEAALPTLHGDMASEYSDRLDSLGLKKQLLEIDMQTGKLTLDMYVVRLKQRILDDRAMIRQLMKRGRKPDAARVLQRVKLMEKELQSTEDPEEDAAAAEDDA